MADGEGLPAAQASTEESQQLLEEMLWRFRVEDASPWTYSMFALAVMVVLLGTFLLWRNIRTRRNQKMQPPEKAKQALEGQCTTEAQRQEDNGLNVVTETLLSAKPDLAQEETEFTEPAEPVVILSDPQESES